MTNRQNKTKRKQREKKELNEQGSRICRIVYSKKITIFWNEIQNENRQKRSGARSTHTHTR